MRLKINPVRHAKYIRTKISRKIKNMYRDVNKHVDDVQDRINYEYIQRTLEYMNSLKRKLDVVKYLYQPASYVLLGASAVGLGYGVYKGLEALLS